jgi:hypothetical protein
MIIFTEKFIPFTAAIHLLETHSLFIYLFIYLFIVYYDLYNNNVPSIDTVMSHGKMINEQ